MTHALLAALARRRTEFANAGSGSEVARWRAGALATLARTTLTSARDVARLHECALFAAAWPDDAHVRARALALLDAFEKRRDLRRFRGALENSGIAGTRVGFRFYQPTARRLARRFPGALTIEWGELEERERLAERLALSLPWAETQTLDDDERELRERIEAWKRRDESDAAFVLARFDALVGLDERDTRAVTPAAIAARALARQLYEELDPYLWLEPARGTPSRTLARHRASRVHFQREALARTRPDLARDVELPPLAVRELGEREGAQLVELAQDAMVVRARDLDAFMAGDARDARWIDCGDGLAFAALGVLPSERLLLESVYGFLTLKNGIPIGYVLASALWSSCEVAFNVFEAFRGTQAAWIYARVLSMLRALFGADTFTVYPYQLGHENEEGLASGAWWFYQKLGFRPRDRATSSLMRSELARIRADPEHRSSRRVLQRLARENVYWSAGAERDDVIGRFPAARITASVERALARFGGARERGVHELGLDLARTLGARHLQRWSDEERLAWTRWTPLLASLGDLSRWSATERRELVAIVRAKGGRRESDFVRRFDAHVRLRRALCRLARVRSSV